MAVIQVHVPKTGGSALRHALRGTGTIRWGHSTPLHQEVSTEHRFIVTLRDPVRRFLSAFAWKRAHMRTLGYSTPADLTRDLSSFLYEWVVFKPQVYWVYSAERLRQRDILGVLFTETLDADFARLRERMGWPRPLPPHGHPDRNEQTYADTLDPEGAARVRDFYAADCRMVEALR